MSDPRRFLHKKLIALMAETGATYRSIYIGTKGVVRRDNLYCLRTGKTAKPRHQTIVSLAAYFKVDPEYFFEEGYPAPDPVDILVDGLLVELGKLEADLEGQRKVLREFVVFSRSGEKLNSQSG